MSLAIGQVGYVAENTRSTSTTAAVNTSATGSGFIITVACQASSSAGPMTCTASDSKSNSYTHLGQFNSGLQGDGYYTVDVFYCGSGTGGSSHTATISFTDSGGIDVLVTLIEVTGAPFTYDQSSGVTYPYDSSSPYNSVSLTVSPPSSGAVLLSSAVIGPNATASESTGFTIQEQTQLGNFVLATATRIVTSSTTYTPSWSVSGGYEALTMLASFLGPASAAGQPPEDAFAHFDVLDVDDDEWITRTPDVLAPSLLPLPIDDAWTWDESIVDDDEWVTRDIDSVSSPTLTPLQYFGDDAERYDDVDDDWPLDDYLNDSAQPPEDSWNHFEDADEDFYTDDASIQIDNNPQLSPSDEYDFFSQDEDDWYEGTDPGIADNNAFLSVEDAWPHFADDDALDEVPLDESNIAAIVSAQYYGEDAELIDSDFDDDEWLARDTDPVGPDLTSNIAADEWDWSQDEDDWYSDDYSNSNLVVNAQYYGEDAENSDVDLDDDSWIVAIEPISPNPTIINAQYYGEDAENADVDLDDDEWTARDTDPVGADNIAPAPLDDAWDWTQDEDEQAPLDEFVNDAPPIFDDAWNHFDDGDDDFLIIDQPVPDAVVSIFDDAWDWQEEPDESLILDDAIAASISASASIEDAPTFDEDVSDSIDEFLEWSALSANLYIPPSQFTDDAWWYWTDEFLDDYEAVGFDYAIIGAAINPKPTRLTVKCAATKCSVSTATTQLVVTIYEPKLGAF